MSLRYQITKTAVELFARNGIKKVSMDDIARNAAVSKRTLYEFFRDKEDLLVETLKKAREPFSELFSQIEQSGETALDIICLFHEKMTEQKTTLCEDFFADVKRYPAANDLILEYKQLFFKKVMELLLRGAREGVFLEDINYDLISFIAHQHIRRSDPPEILQHFSHEEINNTLAFTFIRGICTDKGRAIFEKYVTKRKYKLFIKHEINN